MKTAARPILRRLGFRTVLVGNAVISGGLIMGYGLLRPETPHALIVGLLLMGGFFRSLQFTSINTLAFADVAPERVSQASSLSSTFQHLFLTVGVGLGATLLQLVLLWRGGTGPTPEDFSLTFMAIGLVSASSVLVFMRLAPDAGDEVSGRARAEAD
jgi:hypothetical protein